jgi:serine/threonine protein kinase
MLLLEFSCRKTKKSRIKNLAARSRLVSSMTHSAGDRLGPYEIIALIGAGGMGEVYRARGSRIGREVAVKVSAQQFPERSVLLS